MTYIVMVNPRQLIGERRLVAESLTVDEQLMEDFEWAACDVGATMELIDQLTGDEGPVNTLRDCLTQLVDRLERYGVNIDDYVTLREVREPVQKLFNHLATKRKRAADILASRG